MRATIMPRAQDVQIANVPDDAIQNSTDAVIRITRACIHPTSASARWTAWQMTGR